MSQTETAIDQPFVSESDYVELSRLVIEHGWRTDHGAIAPGEERFFAKRMKATTTELPTSHVAMLSKPKEVAAVIMDAAAKAQH